MKPRNSTRAPLGMRRDEWRLRALRIKSWCHTACSRGSARSRRASVRQLQIALRPLQGLDRRLFVDTENNRFGGRIDVKADHIGGLRHKREGVALASRLADSKVNIVLAQEAPDITKPQRRPRPWPAADPSTGHNPQAAASPEAAHAAVGARQRASSTLRTFGLSRTSLALGTHPDHESSFDLELGLTQEEKWVLVRRT